MAVLSCVVESWRAALLVFTYNMIVLLIEYSVLRVTLSTNMDSTLLEQQQIYMISFRREQIFLISCYLCFITALSFIVFLPLEDISWNYVLQVIKKAVLHEDAWNQEAWFQDQNASKLLHLFVQNPLQVTYKYQKYEKKNKLSNATKVNFNIRRAYCYTFIAYLSISIHRQVYNIYT